MTEHFSTYLNDHLAGAVVALEMLDRLIKSHGEHVNVAVLGSIREEVDADRASLESLMDRLDVRRSQMRRAVGWLSERTAQMKLAVDDPHDGAFRAFEMLQLVSLGIEGKISLWKSLQAVSSSDPILAGTDFDALILRARSQRHMLEPMHAQAARSALETRQAA